MTRKSGDRRITINGTPYIIKTDERGKETLHQDYDAMLNKLDVSTRIQRRDAMKNKVRYGKGTK